MGCARPNTPASNRHDLGELDKKLRDRLYTLFHDAPTRGLTGVSLYRDPGGQWDLRHDRVPHGQECNPAYGGSPLTAVPATWNGSEWVGGSHHQHRKAADIGGRDLQWAIDNRFRYGLGLTVLPENWHFEAEGIDKRTGLTIPEPTVRILTYPGPTYDNPGPFAPNQPPKQPDPQEMTMADIKKILDELASIKKIANQAQDTAAEAKAYAKAGAFFHRTAVEQAAIQKQAAEFAKQDK